MKETAIGVCLVMSLAAHVLREPGESAQVPKDRAADLAGIEKARKQDVAVTMAFDPVGLTDLWTDDAIRIGVGVPAEIGKAAIRATNERNAANKDFKVLSYVPKYEDLAFLEGGWAVDWRTYTASFVTAPGAQPTQTRGTVLLVYKRMTDGSWRAFRGMGSNEPAAPVKGGW